MAGVLPTERLQPRAVLGLPAAAAQQRAERLSRRFRLEQQRVSKPAPIKGTLPRLADAEQDAAQARRLADSPKDRAENLMIVDLLRNDIGRVAQPGSVRVPELFVVEPFPAVHHLVSTITATLPEQASATELLRACFPGGSITGAPRCERWKSSKSWSRSVATPIAAASVT